MWYMWKENSWTQSKNSKIIKCIITIYIPHIILATGDDIKVNLVWQTNNENIRNGRKVTLLT